jgi:uncharacterized SAM-binding protein YcdF (DUF218 family)
MRKKHRKILCGIVCLIVAASVAYAIRQPLLRAMGAYLAPLGTVHADVVIIEGAATVETSAVHEAIALLKAGKVRKIILVVHKLPMEDAIFSLKGIYPRLVHEGLVGKGLDIKEFEILEVPVRDPVTLSEARYVLAHVAKGHYKSAVLMAKGFHMRRSLLVYRVIGKPLHIAVYPSPYYAGYRLESWWLKADGFRDFFSETFKLFYYVLWGYIPFSSLFATSL